MDGLYHDVTSGYQLNVHGEQGTTRPRPWQGGGTDAGPLVLFCAVYSYLFGINVASTSTNFNSNLWKTLLYELGVFGV
jgi:hypothetical protein